MICYLECPSAMIQVFSQYVLWNLLSPTLVIMIFSHVHLPHEIPPSYPKHLLPCKMKGVVHTTPSKVDRSEILTARNIFDFFPKNHM